MLHDVVGVPTILSASSTTVYSALELSDKIFHEPSSDFHDAINVLRSVIYPNGAALYLVLVDCEVSISSFKDPHFRLELPLRTSVYHERRSTSTFRQGMRCEPRRVHPEWDG